MNQHHFAQFEPPDLPPVLVIEATAKGWRGLTADGELLNVESASGHPVEIPTEKIGVTREGVPMGYRAVPARTEPGTIDDYTRCFDSAVRLMKANRLDMALTSIEVAISFASTTTARFNRAIILLSLGRWAEGFAEFENCELEQMFMRPMYREAIEHGFKPWNGEDIRGKRLLLLHDHGFGDSIMMLRFVPHLKVVLGAEVILMLPPELRRLGTQVGTVTANSMRVLHCDYFCSLLYLFRMLKLTPEKVPTGQYLSVNPLLEEKWKRRLGQRRKTIGVAWTPGKVHVGDYARAVPLGALTKTLDPDADLISVQVQGTAEADFLGVEHYPFEDFADCAALMSVLDEIVTIDTAAVHLAGAIGHPKITLLLPYWSSWRWLSPLYDNIRIVRQSHDDADWSRTCALLSKQI